MYLFEIAKHFCADAGATRRLPILKDLLTKYKITLFSADYVEGIRSSLQFCIDVGKHQKYFYISEFPGNCSTLVLNNIEPIYNDGGRRVDVERFLDVVNFCNDFARRLQYYCVVLTTTNKSMKLLLTEHSYKTIIGLNNFVNPHSEKINYFMKSVLVQITVEEFDAHPIPGMFTYRISGRAVVRVGR